MEAHIQLPFWFDLLNCFSVHIVLGPTPSSISLWAMVFVDQVPAGKLPLMIESFKSSSSFCGEKETINSSFPIDRTQRGIMINLFHFGDPPFRRRPGTGPKLNFRHRTHAVTRDGRNDNFIGGVMGTGKAGTQDTFCPSSSSRDVYLIRRM